MSYSTLLVIEQPSASCIDVPGLEQAGYHVHRCLSAAAAFDMASTLSPAIVLVDAFLPDMDISDFVSAFHRVHKDTAILAMVEGGQSQQAAAAMRAGAIDYLLKPFQHAQALTAIEQASSLRQPIPNMVVAAASSRQVIQLAHRAAKTDATVLVSGESGTGKERLAQYIHEVSPRANGPFVALNCAAIPESMLEATLFGHTKGAFTGATASQAGKFEMANGGTLMLDEISEMPLPLQAKLLRVLQEREVERLGSHQKISLDVRIIAATNKNLAEEVDAGHFRQDLFYRLDVLPLSWPALRERKEDILPLTRFFINKYAAGQNYSMSFDAERTLVAHQWPGNVRELENVIQRALIMARGLELQADDLMLPASVAPQPVVKPTEKVNAEGLAASKKAAEFQYVLETLTRFDGHRARAAEALGVTTRALRYKLAAMREQGIDVERVVRGR